MVGEWRLGSSSNRHFSSNRLIILEDSSFYLFSGSDGGSLITNGRLFGIDSINTDYYGDYKINLIDSKNLQLTGGWLADDDFYKRKNYDNYRNNLKEYLQQDSLRHEVVGWWKLVSSKMPVSLINYGGWYKDLTLNIREDGQAIFYLENKLDLTVEYSYHVNPDGIDFDRGCIGSSDSKISFDSNGRMKLVLDKRRGDTLLLEKLTEIK